MTGPDERLAGNDIEADWHSSTRKGRKKKGGGVRYRATKRGRHRSRLASRFPHSLFGCKLNGASCLAHSQCYNASSPKFKFRKK